MASCWPASDDVDPGVRPLQHRAAHLHQRARTRGEARSELVSVWPVRVREIDLIGHSMGGLVIRSACHYGTARRDGVRTACVDADRGPPR